MFSFSKSSAASAIDTTNKETFDKLMALNETEFDNLTNQLARSILNLGADDSVAYRQHLVTNLAETKPSAAATLASFVPTPTPEAFNTTTDEGILSKAKKGTDHHTLYKEMLALSAEEKTSLKTRFGRTLTKFAICNLIFLYTEGSKLDADKGVRNVFAFARLALSAALSTTDRNLKLEFFTLLLAELYSPAPFSRNHGVSFLSDANSTSQYSKVDDANYLTAITRGVNTLNAMTLFDAETLAMAITTTAPAKTAASTTSPECK